VIERGSRLCGLIPVIHPPAWKQVCHLASGFLIRATFLFNPIFFIQDRDRSSLRKPLETRRHSFDAGPKKKTSLNPYIIFFIPEHVLPQRFNPPTSTALKHLMAWQEVKGKFQISYQSGSGSSGPAPMPLANAR